MAAARIRPSASSKNVAERVKALDAMGIDVRYPEKDNVLDGLLVYNDIESAGLVL